MSRLVCNKVELGYERTVEQDAAFGFRQLEDIAVKALSPGINDPVTAAHAIGYMADFLVQVLGCRLGPTVHEDSDGVDRAIVPDRDIAYYIDLCCGQVRRYGRQEPQCSTPSFASSATPLWPPATSATGKPSLPRWSASSPPQTRHCSTTRSSP